MTTRNAKRRMAWGLIAVVGIAAGGLGGCTSGSGNMGDNDDTGWLSGYQADKNNDGQLSQAEVNAAFQAADKDGNGSLSAGERSGGR